MCLAIVVVLLATAMMLRSAHKERSAAPRELDPEPASD
jgi:hypothetical protein